ncbi:hypothetical protein NQ314_007172 [Rhamnusium bicolor]|uniref:Replication protein A subunit n=1 Tax=Rhamnusium bicolor TaxID=1586634 RepID=A0AAV8YQZ6_9CUCU|nr:hypothetical protein NQ314_007172 [Rhamnusium bicolor]
MAKNNYNLSEGALQIIMKGGDVHQPVMQVLGSKKINSGSSDKERYRILLSDGKNSISFAMLTTQINDKVGCGGISTFSVIKIDRYITSVINNTGKGDTRVLLILDMNVIVPGEEVGQKIGFPTVLTDTGSNDQTPASNGNASGYGSSTTANTVAAKTSTANGSVSFNINGVNLSDQLTHPISSLSPYHNKWVIKARVTNKSAVRTWSNSRGEGKLFSVDLLDESGEIRLTGFKEAVDKFYDYIQVDKVYYISKCQLKPANKQFSALKNDYEMTMTLDTLIQECTEDEKSVPTIKYDFVTIDQIQNFEVNTIIDVVGVARTVSELQTFQARSTGKELKKKEIMLVDHTKTSVALTLWGTQAENFDGSNCPVLVIKGARVGEFGGGKNISTLSSSNMKINPEMTDAYRLRGWYDGEGNKLDYSNISAKSGAGNFSTPWLSFKEVQDQGLGNAEKGDYYQVMGTILLIRSENAIYKACPTEECNKKVIDLENGMYRCEKCNREFPNFKYRLLASMNVGDWSGNQWVSMFSSEVEKVIGMTSQEVGEQIEQNPESMVSITEKANFKQFIMKCRAKMETYNTPRQAKIPMVLMINPISNASVSPKSNMLED